MEFKRARSSVQVQERKAEIMKAAKTLLEKNGIDGFNINSISEMTSINRSSFYTYYKTKEEVLLDVLKEELCLWNQKLNSFFQENQSEKATIESLSKFLAGNILKNKRIFQLYSLAFTTLEENSRIENLSEYKKYVIPILEKMKEFFMKSIPSICDHKASILVTQISTFLVGLYPICNMTPKQKAALELCGQKYEEPDFEQILYLSLVAFLKEAL